MVELLVVLVFVVITFTAMGAYLVVAYREHKRYKREKRQERLQRLASWYEDTYL